MRKVIVFGVDEKGDTMKQYEYVAVRIAKFIGGSVLTEHREIMDEYAKKGYGYVGYIPTRIDDRGRITDIDLIFEKSKEKK